MDNDVIITNNVIKGNFVEADEDQKNKLRKETQEKFRSIEKILEKNVEIEKNIKKILDESNFHIYSITKIKYICLSFIVAVLLITSIIVWELHLIPLNFKLFFMLIPLILILISSICYYTVTYICIKMIYRKHINSCKNITFANKNLINLISELLDNQLTISDLLPHSFFKYFIKRHYKTNFDKYIGFLSKHSKTLIKKTKNKNLNIYQGIFVQNSELLDKIIIIEAQYFSSMFRKPLADTIEECVEKFLSDESSIDSYLKG